MVVRVRALNETSALLCGATAGIGLAAARALAAAGVPRIMLVGRNKARGEEAAAGLRAAYPSSSVAFTSADVTQCAGASAAIAAAADQFGAIDLLVNSGGYAGVNGVGLPEMFHRMPMEEVVVASQGLLHGVLLPTRAAIPLMMEQNGGTIINVASDAGKVATPGESVVGSGMVTQPSHSLLPY